MAKAPVPAPTQCDGTPCAPQRVQPPRHQSQQSLSRDSEPRPGPPPRRVTAHFVPHKERSRPITTFMIKFEPSVMQRQAYLEAAKKG